MEYSLTLATAAEAPEILDLYHSHIGTPGCTWSLLYPAEENITRDMGNGALWCLRNGGTLAGVVSIGAPGDVGLLGWEPQHPAELARLAISHDFQGQGLASLLIGHALSTARQNGFDGVVLLVSPANQKAQHLYEKFGFTPDGEVFGWNHPWVRYQQSFN
jgi:ribosomal protein S18 acetylase RimI-like enzyme